MNITITDKAILRLENLGINKGKYLRVSVTSGGCSGNTYNATIEDEMTDKDDIYYDKDDIKIISDQYSSLFIDGLDIDFSDDLIESGFRLTNGNASGSCGCGASFSV